MRIKSVSTLAFTLLFLQLTFARSGDLKPHKVFVIIHGAWQAPWAWQKVKELLESKGQQVILVELPGHGIDTVEAKNIDMEAYETKVVNIINEQKQKIVLVGHGLGGLVITSVAQKVPRQIEKLIYVSGFIPLSGQSLSDLLDTDKETLVQSAAWKTDSTQVVTIMRNLLAAIFCADCSVDVQQKLLLNFKEEPALPFQDKVFIDSRFFAKFDKYYLKTLEDQAIGPDLQSRMIAAAGITKVYPVQSGHSPFLSMPAEVATILLDIVKYKITISAFTK